MFSEKLEMQDSAGRNPMIPARSRNFDSSGFAARLLRGHLETGRLAPTYLLTGQNTPRTEIAMAFAAALNCEKKKYFQDCDCQSCHKFQTGNHPDIHILGEDLKVKSIKIEEVRKVIGQASLKPYEGRWKVFILLQAGRLTADASNALLKTLEEPPAHTLFILTAESKMQFLETIQSRCFEVRLRPNSNEFGTLAETGSSGRLRRPESAAMPEISVLSFSGKNWEDFFEEQAGGQKDELKQTLDGLLAFFRRQIQQASEPSADVRRLKAVDLILEAKDALESNVNPKLAMTKLAVNFRKLKPEIASLRSQ